MLCRLLRLPPCLTAALDRPIIGANVQEGYPMRLMFLCALLLWPAPAQAVDLGEVDRTLEKEPAYKGDPKYCLVVFGPEGKTRVWLVLDGDVLYVDRNGNGDLTEEGERVEPKPENKYGRTFQAVTVRDGRLTHTLEVGSGPLSARAEDLRGWPEYQALLRRDPRPTSYWVLAEVAMPGWRGTGGEGRVKQEADPFDSHGILQFAPRPQEAPVVHFGGPWVLSTVGRPTLTIGRPTDLQIGFGTPGRGPGTFAYVAYEQLVPGDVCPVAEITYPGDSRPVRQELKLRC
jgi:hypothetical protein